MTHDLCYTGAIVKRMKHAEYKVNTEYFRFTFLDLHCKCNDVMYYQYLCDQLRWSE